MQILNKPPRPDANRPSSSPSSTADDAPPNTPLKIISMLEPSLFSVKTGSNIAVAAQKEILDLVQRFELQIDSYKSGQYNETQLRREFLDPFFKALGWDIDNESGYAEAYKDVIHEDAIKIGEATKAPDYCFRIGGTRKFFLEAKKPSVWIKNEPAPAYQLRRYAWSSKLPLSILSDFEEFAVYDCRIKPDLRDSASTARIQYYTFREYAEKWDDIAAVFSRAAVLKGSFDRYAETTKGKRGTADVDDEFLKTIESWRSDLAKNLARKNPNLTQRELNFAVQRIIDRIIFLRICEGRGIEDYARLQALVNGDQVYPRLCELFTQADDRYNSGLFHFKPEKGRHEAPDELTLKLEVDDKLLKGILKSLYYPESPYVFSALPADILGQVYEQFLGKVIRLTESHNAVVEEKPEVKKAGGVYYTPTYIVEYIVQNTVGKLITDILSDCSSRREEAVTKPTPTRKKKSKDSPEPDLGLSLPAGTLIPEGNSENSPATLVPGPEYERASSPGGTAERSTQQILFAKAVLTRVAKLRILDPACGSGSFLLGAYEYLLKWHLDFYTANNPEHWASRKNPPIVQVSSPSAPSPSSAVKSSGNWRLTISERKRILLANIYGVDIDAQAVETIKLSLLLKVLEGETQQSLQPFFRTFHERALPDLGDNIKCGNSLIGPDFYNQPEMNLSEDEQYKINVFDWKAEFPEIFKNKTNGNELHETPASPLDYSAPGVPLHGPFSYKTVRSSKSSAARELIEPGWEGGFDAVIGNPPYVRQESLSELKEYLSKHYAAFDGVADLYTYFIERGLQLLRPGGLFSIIVSSSFLRTTYGEPLRRTIKKLAAVRQIVDFGGLAIFDNAKDTYVCIPLFQRGGHNDKVAVCKITSIKGGSKLAEFVPKNCYTIPHERLSPEAWALKSDAESAAFAKILKIGQPLGSYVNGRFFRGVTTGLNEAFTVDQETRNRLIAEDKRSAELIHPVLSGEDIRRYYHNGSKDWLIFTRRGVDISRYPAIRKHLERWRDDLAPKRDKTQKRGHYLANTAYCLGTDDLYLLGVLNSRLFWFAISNISIPFGVRAGEYRYRLVYQYMEKVPIRVIDQSVPSDKACRQQIVKLVEQMLSLQKSISSARTPQEKISLERQIAATDAQIDRLVYELYDLTPEEIAIVEGKSAEPSNEHAGTE
jgi:hypothetical protein